MVEGLTSNVTYVYDDANRLVDVNGVPYTWDNNGNLLNDGTNSYTYDTANRLIAFSGPQGAVSYAYNGLGDRLQETVDGETTTFTMDLNTGLTQALSDGTNTYLYGLARLAQVNTETEYFLGDALGSVRQMADEAGQVTYMRAYDPYGVVREAGGTAQTDYGFTNENMSQGLVYLRARYYSTEMGRFLTKDSWIGDYTRPMSLNSWIYVEGNPVNITDPTGHVPTEAEIIQGRHVYSCNCGWIDFAHASPVLSRDIIKLLNAMPNIPTNLNVREDALLVSMRMKFPFSVQIVQNAVIKTGLSESVKKEVALGMFMGREGLREILQGFSPWAHTSFSEEDYVSDLIGFYMSDLGMTENAKTNDLSWSWLAKTCCFPVDREKAKQWSLDVFRSYPTFEKVKEWGTPRLVCTYDTQRVCRGSGSWPSVFTAISPEEASISGNWWWYRGISYDGRFFRTEISDVYLLEKKE